MDIERFHQLALECGFELSGVAAPDPLPDAQDFLDWVRRGLAGEMRYLTDRRAHVRTDPSQLLPSVRSILCLGKLYNTPHHSVEEANPTSGWISRYAWGEDYHDVLRRDLKRLASRIEEETGAFEYKICVDTAPLLERSYARQAGLGWIGRNTCLINQKMGSWFFLGEILTSLDLTPGSPPPDRCGTCTRCIEACPTTAIVPRGGGFELDATRCISYFTIELRGTIPEPPRSEIGNHIFGCDICQDVCPWNGRAPFAEDPAFAPRHFAPPLDELAGLSDDEFRRMYTGTPITRTGLAGFLRNVAIAMGNSGQEEFRAPLERLAQFPNGTVAEHADWALDRLALCS